MAGIRLSIKKTVAAVDLKYNLYSLLTGAVTGATASVSKFSTGLSRNVKKLSITNEGPGNLFIGDGTLAATASPANYEKRLEPADEHTFYSTGNQPGGVSLPSKYLQTDTDDTFLTISYDP